ncbi:hypothetical protein N8878_02540 [Psychromonas sp.]|nr:hypothetical protein [Psychromonas sp.]
MVNVNVQLPPVIAAPFHQSTESLQRDNALQTAIPKTEETHAYTKMRDKNEREQVAHQSHQIIQQDYAGKEKQSQSRAFNQRRDFFFATKLKLSPHDVDDMKVQLTGISDYKKVLSVIQQKYVGAVSPFPEPSVNYNV